MERLIFGAFFTILVAGWFVLALVVWLVLWHPLLLLSTGLLLGAFAVVRKLRGRGTLAGPRQ